MCVSKPPAARAPPAFSARLREALAQNHRRAPTSSSALSGGAGVTASEPQCRITPRSSRPKQRPPGRRQREAQLPPRQYPSADSPPLTRRRLWIVGEEKPLHERAPGRARPRADLAAAQIGKRARARGSCCGGPGLARARDGCQGLGGGDGEGKGRGLSARSLVPNYGLFPPRVPSLMCEGKETKFSF